MTTQAAETTTLAIIQHTPPNLPVLVVAVMCHR